MSRRRMKMIELIAGLLLIFGAVFCGALSAGYD